MIYVGIALVILVMICIIWSYSLANSDPELLWDWNTLDVDKVLDEPFPDDFLWGSATAAHQVEGGNDKNNWYWWEHQVDKKGNPRIHGGQKSGSAAEHWTRYPEDIKMMSSPLSGSITILNSI